MDAFLRPEAFAQRRKTGASVGRRAFDKLKEQVENDLLRIVTAHDSGKTWDTDFRREATAVMRRAWKEAFILGVRASGIVGRGKGKAGAYAFDFKPEDERWLKSAVAHELRFFNKFLTAVTEQSYKMPLPRRVRMYVSALDSFYDNARVLGMPTTSAFWWTGPKDKRTCASCEYMRAHSPFHKKTLPTVPRSGATICLTNCRDRLLVRIVGADKALSILNESKFTREQHVKNLAAIKKLRSIPARMQP